MQLIFEMLQGISDLQNKMDGLCHFVHKTQFSQVQTGQIAWKFVKSIPFSKKNSLESSLELTKHILWKSFINESDRAVER